MVIRGTDGNLYWQDLDTGDVSPYTGQDGGAAAPVTADPNAVDPNAVDEGALRVANGLGGGDVAAPPPPPQTAETFDPNQHAITKIVKLPGGTQYQYTDPNGQAQVAFIPDGGGTGGGGGGGVTAGQSLAAQQQSASLAQNQSQFQSTQDMERAKFNENYALDQGKTLLGLGSRPDTLIKYLYAIRGQQTPQAINGTTTNLPGFQNVVGQPNPGGAAGPAAAGPAPSPGGAPTGLAPTSAYGNNAPAGTSPIPGTPYVGVPGAGLPVPHLASGGMTIPGTSMTQGTSTNALTAQAAANGGTVSGPGGNPIYTPGTATPAGAGVGANLGGLTRSVPIPGAPFTWDVGVTPPPPPGSGSYSGTGLPPPPPMVHMAAGGVVPEPVMGIGMHSGQHYMFGEQAPNRTETVVPQGKTVAEVKHQGGAMAGGMHHYAAGGTIGADPSVAGPSADFFNPSSLPSLVSRGYNSTPNVPFFPNFGIATNGGQSLIPSAQRYNSLLPSEQQNFQGALTDEFGAQPDDVLAMSQQLMPHVSGLHTPRFAN